jgi:hypothetical protein
MGMPIGIKIEGIKDGLIKKKSASGYLLLVTRHYFRLGIDWGFFQRG